MAINPLTSGLEATQDAINYNQWIWESVRPHIRGRIMEAGGGLGTFSDKLIASGFKDLVICDIDTVYISHLKKKYKSNNRIQIIRCDLSSVAQMKPVHRVDTVLSINTFEHIKNDIKAMENISKKLKKAGKLIVFVPALRKLYGNWDRSIGHERRYEKKELIDKINSTGLKILECKFFNLPGVIGWWLNAKLGSTPDRQSVHIQIEIYDRYIVPFWSKIESLVPPPIGQSLVLVAEKQ